MVFIMRISPDVDAGLLSLENGVSDAQTQMWTHAWRRAYTHTHQLSHLLQIKTHTSGSIAAPLQCTYPPCYFEFEKMSWYFFFLPIFFLKLVFHLLFPLDFSTFPLRFCTTYCGIKVKLVLRQNSRFGSLFKKKP